MILVVSKDSDFALPLIEQIGNELALPCQQVKTYPEAMLLAQFADLVISGDGDGDYSCPVIKVSPPVRLGELLEDIGAQLKNTTGGEEVMLPGGYVLRQREKELLHSASGKTVSLTGKEVQLVRALAEAKGIAAKDTLLKEVWGIGSPMDTHTLETHIYRLRGKFRELAGDDIIEAAEGGYGLKGMTR